MNRAFFDAPGEVFSRLSPSALLGKFVAASPFDDVKDQKGAWIFEIPHLQSIARALPQAHFFVKFSIPRMGRRADAIVVAGPLIFVLEYKVGEKAFPRHAIEQTYGYALDLKNFHATSHDKAIIPILIATKAPCQQIDFGFWAADQVNSPVCCAADDVLPTILRFLATTSAPLVQAETWAAGAYHPTPTIIEAAEALYAGHDVREISRYEAGIENLTRTTDSINNVVARMKAEGGKAICFVTGVPGAGKTLAGLNIAAGQLAQDSKINAAYLSGNGPLVAVLTTALKRDLARRARNQNLKKQKLYLLGRAPDAIIQAIHKFRDAYLKNPGPPFEHVVVFDEAQRAWGKEKASKFMAKHGHHDFDQSEPAYLLSVMNRRTDWCVVICLIGDGQEIHDGEAGIGEWLRALQAQADGWKVFSPPRLQQAGGPLDAGLIWYLNRVGEPPDPGLHLDVSIRSFRSNKVSDFIGALLGNDAAIAFAKRPDIGDFPIYRTRSIDRARRWLRDRRRGSERSGLLASSNGLRLKPEGLFVKAKIDGPTWFLNSSDDVRSSSALEEVATEFDVQGLELDWTCVAWDSNLRYQNGWRARSFKGTKWQKTSQSHSGISNDQYVRNAYRVLLTRARQGMVIFIPRGDAADCTRPPADYDAIDTWLAACGIPELAPMT